MSEVHFKDKFIAYVDVLGFKAMTLAAESGRGMTLSGILKATRGMADENERLQYEEYGPSICPCAPHIQKNLDMQLTQISDCVVVSAEISPSGVINLIGHCSLISKRLLMSGMMCRGYIKRGLIHHTRENFVGSGFNDAYHKSEHGGVSAFKQDADERGTPFIEIDPEVVIGEQLAGGLIRFPGEQIL